MNEVLDFNFINDKSASYGLTSLTLAFRACPLDGLKLTSLAAGNTASHGTGCQ